MAIVTFGFLFDFFSAGAGLEAERFWPTLGEILGYFLQGVTSLEGTILFSLAHSLNALNYDLFSIVISGSSSF
jgi:hypothetical protein